MDRYQQFQEFRTRLNEKILGPSGGTLVTKRFFSLDDQAYRDTSGESPAGLDKKTKELIALALGVAAHCDGCLGFHTRTLARLGATRAEVGEALGMAIYMGGGPSLMYAADALRAFDEFSQGQ